ncbi:MAG: hypothetical protein COT25_01715 [Candidatus Kerfeldbacteria bacterium CG08_land_8_20_14_0_20_42_7]|uniref:DUF4342 domain-containing protein n=1 Tax=Candidatus Kerfeldbacteria bacterium CG08_land_8_20_14_0_20_42_7 TaxID=2014245 RepID=A0A2H0YVC5_9BACT|nr:MAG: hypothetical protein COT25_01715 [Candidatus Kerfeldbacteria bacterium CG08_land_8_20_14_0_20_42_7]
MEEQKEEFKVSGDELVKKVKEIIKKGNARKIIIKNETEEEIMTLPLTIGVVGTLVAAPLVAVGAIAALMTNCTIVVVKK